MLYPIKFKPRIKERIWGGQAILKKKGSAASRLAKDKLYGESWDLSSVKGDISVARAKTCYNTFGEGLYLIPRLSVGYSMYSERS